MKDLLLLTPPFTQLNTPYPATAYLKGFLNTKNISSYQFDLGIEVILKVFTKQGLEEIFELGKKQGLAYSPNAKRIASMSSAYVDSIDIVISFLQGKQPNLARSICNGFFLSQASRFDQLAEMEWAFGEMGLQDKAKHLATLYLEDLSDYIVEAVDPFFGFSRYAERLGRSANSFGEIYNHLSNSKTPIDEYTLRILSEKIIVYRPKIICMSVPFPGNLYSAFRCGQYIKENFPEVKIAMGGGFANTELRSLKDPRVFEFVDFISLDDGELPVELIYNNVVKEKVNHPDKNLFKRTYLLENGEVVYNNFSLRKDYSQEAVGTPDYSDLKLDQYISVIEVANPMHSLWSDGRWLKLTMAHGCYWGKCTFCDISLDYIKNYEPVAAKQLVDRMESLIGQTGERGFHFVDEAAPPALMREVAIEIIRRKLSVVWWTNIRFEKSFSADLCKLLRASGCIAVSGGLEVASDRLLKLIDKGVTVEQVAQVTRNFTESGIMVHAYLMYGYPTQTIQETVDSLEMVRQLFEMGVLQSGFWHQFALTAHSPIGKDPESYGILPKYEPISFADNDIQFEDATGIDHDQFSFGLKKSLYNFMHGACFDHPLQNWFDFDIPKTSISKNYIEDCLSQRAFPQVKPSTKLIWILASPELSSSKTGKSILKVNNHLNSFEWEVDRQVGEWLVENLIVGALQCNAPTINPNAPTIKPKSATFNRDILTYEDLKNSYEMMFGDFTLFWYSELMEEIKDIGLLQL